MKFLQPILRATRQKTSHLVAAEIENEGVPFGMEPLPRIDMLVQRAAVEAPEPERIRRKMRRSPIENYSDTIFMQAVDQVTKIVGRSIAGSRGIVTRRLI